ncbi:MAG: tRNA pseudouridine(38-40) synthase TruA [Gammaproteobacteria bacterium]|nr:tRNA pseudouridine(38-40) synthase TruA [Gammaproteobacteria bacterium]
MRIALGVEYNGSGFCGWQKQSHGERTIQACIEQALSKVASHEIHIVCAGRTDTGVHAVGQVIHFDTDVERSERSWVFGANANLPKDISILWAAFVDDEFHARFSAQHRAYRYVIFSRPIRPSFLRHRVSWEYRPLDEARMRQAAGYLVGEHDFSSYRTVACQAKSPVRIISRLELSHDGPFYFIDIEANAFLHHMVRNIAGVLMSIGAGEHEPEWAQEVLEAKDRTQGGITAPPHGLYLSEVGYPEHFGLPRLSPAPAVW